MINLGLCRIRSRTIHPKKTERFPTIHPILTQGYLCERPAQKADHLKVVLLYFFGKKMLKT